MRRCHSVLGLGVKVPVETERCLYTRVQANEEGEESQSKKAMQETMQQVTQLQKGL